MAGITTFLDASQLPGRSQDQQTFDNAMAYVMQNFPKWGSEINATLAALAALAAGGVYAMPYKFSTTTTDGDPGAGFLRLDSATQNAATMIRLDLAGMDTADYTGLIDTFDASTSAIKGQIRIAKQADPSKFIDFNVTARATPTGYRNISVTTIASTSQSPFANNDPVMLFFQRTGDKGDPGSTYGTYAAKFSDRKATGTAGGTATANSIAQTRAINTAEYNTIAGASLASNQITVPAGTYDVKGRAPASNVGAHKAFLYNVTDGTYALIGSSAYSGSGTNLPASDSVFSGRITLAAAKTFAVRHYTTGGGSATSELGANTAGTGQSEVFTEVEFVKAA